MISVIGLSVWSPNMKHFETGTNRSKFDLLTATRPAKAAMMTLRPGRASDDDPSNEHLGSEQWGFVLSAHGVAQIGRLRNRLGHLALTEN